MIKIKEHRRNRYGRAFRESFSFTDIDKLIDFISYELQKPVILESADFFCLPIILITLITSTPPTSRRYSQKCPVQILKGF